MQTIIVGAKTPSFSAISVPRSQFSARKSIAATQRIIQSSSSQKKLISLNNNNKRNSALVVRAEGGDDGFEVPDFVKDLMKTRNVVELVETFFFFPFRNVLENAKDRAVLIEMFSILKDT